MMNCNQNVLALDFRVNVPTKVQKGLVACLAGIDVVWVCHSQPDLFQQRSHLGMHNADMIHPAFRSQGDAMPVWINDREQSSFSSLQAQF
jgi:hypothetical protein